MKKQMNKVDKTTFLANSLVRCSQMDHVIHCPVKGQRQIWNLKFPTPAKVNVYFLFTKAPQVIIFLLPKKVN